MKILADKNLAKDLSKLDKKHTKQLLSLIEIIKNSNTPSEIPGIKKLKELKTYFALEWEDSESGSELKTIPLF